MREWMVGQLQDPNQYRIVFGKLNSIEVTLAAGSIGRDDIWKQSALGVALGDALCQQLRYLKWVTVIDAAGRDIALQWQQTEVVVFPLAEFSSRIQRSESISSHDIYRSYVDLFESHCRPVA